MAVRHSRIPVRHSAARRRAEAHRRAATRSNPLARPNWTPCGLKIPFLMTPVETYHNDTSNQDKYWAKWKKCTEKRVKKNKKYYHPKHGLIHPQDGLAFSTESKCKSHYKKYEKHKAKAVASGTKVEEKGITVAGSTYEDSGTSGKTVYKKGSPANRVVGDAGSAAAQRARDRKTGWDEEQEVGTDEFLLTDDGVSSEGKNGKNGKNGKKKYVALAVAGLVVVGGVFWFASKSS